jgi:hypothetical protein
VAAIEEEGAQKHRYVGQSESAIGDHTSHWQCMPFSITQATTNKGGDVSMGAEERRQGSKDECSHSGLDFTASA